MWVSVSSTPGTLLMLPAMTSATSWNSRTRTIAIRSTWPATEYTSLTPGRSASACATSGMASVEQVIMTIEVITAAGLLIEWLAATTMLSVLAVTPEVAVKDWHGWHDAYDDPASSLARRLAIGP